MVLCDSHLGHTLCCESDAIIAGERIGEIKLIESHKDTRRRYYREETSGEAEGGSGRDCPEERREGAEELPKGWAEGGKKEERSMAPPLLQKGEGELERGLLIVDVLHVSGIELLDEGIEFQALSMLEDEA